MDFRCLGQSYSFTFSGDWLFVYILWRVHSLYSLKSVIKKTFFSLSPYPTPDSVFRMAPSRGK